MILADSWDLQKRSHWEQRALESGVLSKRWKGFGRFSGCWKQAAGGPEDMGPCEAWRGGGAQSICGGPTSGVEGGSGVRARSQGRKPHQEAGGSLGGGGSPECPGAEARDRRAEKEAMVLSDKRPTGDSGLLCRVTNSPHALSVLKAIPQVGRSSVSTDTKNRS